MGEATRQVGQAMYWSVLARVGRFALGLASSIIIVRALGKHEYGVLSLLRVVLIFVAILSLVIVYAWKKGLFEWNRRSNPK